MFEEAQATPEASKRGTVLTLMRCWRECRLVQPLRKEVQMFFKKLKMELPYEPAIPLLGIEPKKPETLIRKNICAPLFIAALFKAAVHLHNGILLSHKK